jgi:hypothetical protein
MKRHANRLLLTGCEYVALGKAFLAIIRGNDTNYDFTYATQNVSELPHIPLPFTS